MIRKASFQERIPWSTKAQHFFAYSSTLGPLMQDGVRCAYVLTGRGVDNYYTVYGIPARVEWTMSGRKLTPMRNPAEDKPRYISLRNRVLNKGKIGTTVFLFDWLPDDTSHELPIPIIPRYFHNMRIIRKTDDAAVRMLDSLLASNEIDDEDPFEL